MSSYFLNADYTAVKKDAANFSETSATTDRHIEASEKSMIFITPLSESQTPHKTVLSGATPLRLLARWIHGKEVIQQLHAPVTLSREKIPFKTQRYVFYKISTSHSSSSHQLIEKCEK